MRVCSALIVAAALGASLSCTGGDAVAPSPPATTVPPIPPVPQGPPKPLESATITIRSSGFVLDTTSAASYTLADLHVYQGGSLLFLNDDIVPHDVLSDPPHIHSDCPEINVAGYLVPGQSRSTGALNRIITCGFHDHTHEGNPRFSGKVTVEQR
jgi:hypothetical protein